MRGVGWNMPDVNCSSSEKYVCMQAYCVESMQVSASDRLASARRVSLYFILRFFV
jgi:hypothetical protein